MKIRKSLIAATFLGGSALAASTGVLADDTGWYGGVNIGRSHAKIDADAINTGLLGLGFTNASTSKDENDTGYKIFAGYNFTKNFALEGGYFDLGKFSFNSTTAPAGTLQGTLKVSGFNLDAVGILPIQDNFSVFGRVGVQYAETKDSFSGTGAVVVTNPNPKKSETNYKMGLGAGYDFTKTVGLRAEWERYRVSDGLGDKGDVDLYSLGLRFKF